MVNTVKNFLIVLKKRAIQKTAEATGNLIGKKIADAVAKSYDNNEITRTTS